jgi:hypothetical protein
MDQFDVGSIPKGAPGPTPLSDQGKGRVGAATLKRRLRVAVKRRFDAHLWELVLWIAVVLAFAAAGAAWLFVPREARTHGDVSAGNPVPIWENNTELRVALVAAFVLLAFGLVIAARRNRRQTPRLGEPHRSD